MDQDTLKYDSLADRPLPRWLTDQRDGLNTIQPVIKEPKEDRSLGISFALTITLIFLVIAVFTIVLLRKKKRNML